MSRAIDKLRKILIELNFSASAKTVSEDSDLFETGAIDSLTLIQYVLAIEDEFKIRIENSDITYENFKTFNTLSQFIEKKYLKTA
ncbi:MAG: acyl carrier protein [Bdellovibrionales bacterium]|nr:acyl carrier protein [Bdellovibrionales bacterium]